VSDEVELISDGEGLAVVGDKRAVERFLRDRGLLAVSEMLGIGRLSGLVQGADVVVKGASELASSSGRWVKLTEKSAALVEEFGFMETSTPGVSHAMIGDPGSISKWLQVETGAGAILTNPALLAGALGMMSQVARQQEVREIKAYLARIDGKLDDVRRAQRNAILAKLDGVAESLREAMAIREHVGSVSAVTWSTVQNSSGSIAEVQSAALRSLGDLTDRLERAAKIGELAAAAREAQKDVAVWLTVLARCFELRESISILQLDYVAATEPHTLEATRSALVASKQERRELIVRHTGRLLAELDAAVGDANLDILLHLPSARAVVDAVNHVGTQVDDFAEPLGLDAAGIDARATRWRDAIRDGRHWKRAAKEAGPKVAAGAVVVGAGVLVVFPQTRGAALKVLSEAVKKLR
jgi:hypothetical protein